MVALALLMLSAVGPDCEVYAAEVPRVAVLYSSFREGACSYRDEYDADLARLGWPAEKFENTRVADLAGRLADFDLIIGTAVFNFEHPQDLTQHADALGQWVRYGGVMLLTDMNYPPQTAWLEGIEPGLRIAVSNEKCASDGAQAKWTDARHPLLSGVAKVPGVWTHPAAVSGLWSVLARCDEGQPILEYRELGDGIIVASHIYRQYGFPEVAFLQNLWRWARDEGRINSVRDREERRYRALQDPKELDAKRVWEPVMDGLLDDETWKQAARTSEFVTTENTGVAEQGTTALIGLDDYYLYVGFQCADNDIADVLMDEAERDGAVYHDDCVELFVAPTEDAGSYKHFIVNAAGVLYDEDTIDPDWDGVWEAKTQRHPRGWNAELRIPLVMLGAPRDFAEEWAVNLNRHYPRTGELSGWSPTFGSFAAPAHFGKLKKVQVDANRYRLEVNHMRLEDGGLSISFANPTDGDLRGRYVVDVLSPTGQTKRTARELFVPKRGTAAVETEHRLDEPGTYTLRAQAEVGGGPVWISEPVRHEVAAWLEVTLPNQAYRSGTYETQPWSKDVRVVAQVRDAREGMTLEVTLTGVGPKLRERKPLGGEGTVEVSFPGDALQAGAYALNVRLMQGKRELEAETQTVFVHPRGPGTELVFDADGIAYLDGGPFLPLGLYHVSEPVADLVTRQNAAMDLPPLTHEAMLDDVAAKGFNCFVRGWGMPSQAFLDLADERGLKVMPEIGGMAEDALREAVRMGRDHPALLMWYGVDEPAGGKLERSLAIRDIFAAEDPHHPVGAALNNPGLFAKAEPALDVLMPDPYPLPRAPIDMVTVYCEQAERARPQGKALWCVPQAFAVQNAWREPTPEELRNMTYQALVAGARGLVWYAYYTTESHDDFGMPRNPKRKQWWYPETPLWDYHAELNTELRSLEDAILSPGGELVATNEEKVWALLRETPTRKVLIAVSADDEAKDVTLVLPEPTDATEAKVLGEERTVEVDGTIMADRFEPLAVHVYEW